MKELQAELEQKSSEVGNAALALDNMKKVGNDLEIGFFRIAMLCAGVALSAWSAKYFPYCYTRAHGTSLFSVQDGINMDKNLNFIRCIYTQPQPRRCLS